MVRLTRSFAWSKTPVGRAAAWPQSLKTAVRIMLDSRYAMWLGWGSGLTFFYNDAYGKMTLGQKHPWALGRPAREVWSEIWEDIGPRAASVVQTGEATWDQGLMLLLERRGFAEETYHTFSYSPVPDDLGKVGGLLCVVTEETGRTIGERRLRTLRELASRTAEGSRSVEEACRTAAASLAENPYDLPFVLLYLVDPDGRRITLGGLTGIDRDQPMSPVSAEVDDPDSPWPFSRVYETGGPVEVSDLPERFGPLPGGAWTEPSRRAIVIPMAGSGQTRPVGFIVAGVSPRLPLDDGYRGFFDLLAGQLTAAVANARAYDEERRRAESLAELDRAKTVFFSNVSHEFRTPLTLMLGPLDDLLSNSHAALPPAVKDELEIVNRNGMRLLRLVNSLLDFSRIEAGRVHAAYQPTDLATYTSELASVFRAATERAGLRLIVDCPKLEEPVFVDRAMWEKVVLNLLSNAFKFTFEGEIVVSLRQAEGVVALKVADTGTGVAPEETSRLFERFHRIENARGRTHEGSGIGLALVRELVKLHGGSISVESTLGRGTTFLVTLRSGSGHLPSDQVVESRGEASAGAAAAPYLEEALQWLPGDSSVAVDGFSSTANGRIDQPGPASIPTEGSDGRPLVLVADDNADMRRYISRLLADQYEVVAVRDGEEALAEVQKRLPDLVLTDVMMPRLDGFGLLRRLRDDPRTGGLPILILSARAGEESRVEGMEAGADDYLVKPFSARELLARVGAHVQMARMRREAGESLREGDERLRMALAAARMVAWQYDPSTDALILSDNASHVLGLEAGVPIPDLESLLRLLHPDDVERRREATSGALAEGASYQCQFRMIRPVDGETIWVEERGRAVGEGGPGARRLIGVLIDVTDRRRAEHEAREARSRLESALAAGEIGTWEFDAVADVIRIDRNLGRMIGATSEDAARGSLESYLEIVHPDDRRRVADEVGRILDEGEGFESEFRLVRPDRSVCWVVARGRVERDEAGRPVQLPGVAVDITERKLAEEGVARLMAESEQQRRTYETALSNTPDFNYVFDLEGRFRYINTALLDLLQKSVDEAVGRNFFELDYPPELAARLDAQIQRVIETRDPIRDETPFRSHLGVRQYEYIFVPVLGESDAVEAVVGSTRDITERKRLEDELRRIAADLSDADRRKDEFLATLAHELRNPLAPIRNGLEVLRAARGDHATFEETRGLIERQVAHMVRLIDDLMDVSRITGGKLRLRKERVELATIVRNAVEAGRPLIDASRHRLEVTLPSRPIVVEADATRLSQVVSNLLNNAAKYTEAGGDIALRVERQGDEVVVSVRDDGMGIPADMLPRVFDMFTQVEQSLERSQGGLGIGLTLVKRIVEMHGGSIQARSGGRGKGSEFTVRLPIVTEESARTSDEGPEGRSVEAAPSRRVLVVDDNRDAARTLTWLLKSMGNDARAAYDGGEAVESADAWRPEVVLLDIGLPVMNGYDVARTIRSRPWGADVVIAALTGWGQEGDRLRSSEAGIDLHLVKPVDPAELEKFLAGIRPAPA